MGRIPDKPQEVYKGQKRGIFDFRKLYIKMSRMELKAASLHRKIKEKYTKFFSKNELSIEIIQCLTDAKLLNFQRNAGYYFKRDIKNETSFLNKLARCGITGGEAETVIAKWKKYLVVEEREIFSIVGGRRTFPNPIFIKQILDVLDLTMEDILLDGNSEQIGGN